MSKAWKRVDLAGGGVQSINLRMTRLQRRPARAYVLWLLFPLGAHRFYLGSRVGGLAYVGVTAAVAAAVALGLPAWPGLGVLAAYAVSDLRWIDGRITKVNKELRMSLYRDPGAAPPPGYSGRHNDEPEALLEEYRRIKEGETCGVQPPSPTAATPGRRLPSFQEQEAMLRAMKTRKSGQGGPDNNKNSG